MPKPTTSFCFLQAIVLFLALAANHIVLASDGFLPKDITDPEYFKSFPPAIVARIQSDAQEVAKAYNLTTEYASTICTNFWLEKCKILRSRGKFCRADDRMSEKEFQTWLKDPQDLYEGVSCHQLLRAAQEHIRRDPDSYIPK